MMQAMDPVKANRLHTAHLENITTGIITMKLNDASHGSCKSK
jgi:hypothetical protein